MSKTMIESEKAESKQVPTWDPTTQRATTAAAPQLTDAERYTIFNRAIHAACKYRREVLALPWPRNENGQKFALDGFEEVIDNIAGTRNEMERNILAVGGTLPVDATATAAAGGTSISADQGRLIAAIEAIQRAGWIMDEVFSSREDVDDIHIRDITSRIDKLEDDVCKLIGWDMRWRYISKPDEKHNA